MIRKHNKYHIFTDENNVKYTGVNKLIYKFKVEEDWDKLCEKTAAKRGVDPKELRAEWDAKAEKSKKRGVIYHEFMERKYESMNKPFIHINKKLMWDNCSFKDGHVYIEQPVWDTDKKIIGIVDYIQVKDNSINIIDYKGLSLDTEIPTTKGFKLMKDITKDDVLFDGEGNPTKIKNISSIHNNPCYKIKFDTNDTVICDHEHRWVIEKRIQKGIYKTDKFKVIYEEDTVTTEELLIKLKNKEKLRILCTKPLNITDTPLPIDPYVFGLWLGDGHSADGKITNMHKHIWGEIEKRGYIIGDDVSGGGSGKASTRTIFGLANKLNTLNLLKNKHLPELYLFSSYYQRLDVLRGLMDADGHYNKTRKRFTMCTTKIWQAKAVLSLVSSLGFKPTFLETYANYNGKKIKVFHVNFITNGVNPFLIRNQNVEIKQTIKSKYRYIKSIDVIKTVETKCLEVDSPSHTYLFSRNFIKTHNTNEEIKFESFKDKRYLNPLSHIPDCNAFDYYLQINFYMYLSLKNNPKLKMGKMFIEHVTFDWDDNIKDTTMIPVPNYQKEINLIINHV